MKFDNAVYLDETHRRISCRIEHPRFGWIPFTAYLDDIEEEAAGIATAIAASGRVAPFVKIDAEAELAAWRVTASCTPLQGQLALGEERWTRVEAVLADPLTPWAMKRTILSASVWKRNSQEIDELAWILGLSPAEVDDLFRVAMTINA